MSDAAIELLERMLQIPSPPREERRLAEFVAGAMEELGLAACVDEVANVVGETGTGEGPTVLLVGHLDTAPGELPVRNDGARLWGRGAADAKGPLAAMIVAAAEAATFPGRLLVAGAVEEETPASRGAHHLAANMDDAPDAIVVGEPSGWSTITLGYKGKVDLIYRATRPATHPTNPVPKASELAAAFWAEASALAGGHEAHASFNEPAVTLSWIGGDLEAAELEVCFRTPPGYDIDGLLEELRRAAGDAELELLARVAAVRTDRRDPVVRALAGAIRRRGGDVQLKLKTATSDANVFAEYWDVPMATYGPGDSRLDHSDDEHIELEEYLKGIRVLGDALETLAGLEPAGTGPATAAVAG